MGSQYCCGCWVGTPNPYPSPFPPPPPYSHSISRFPTHAFCTNGLTDGRMDQCDKVSYRVAGPRPKRKSEKVGAFLFARADTFARFFARGDWKWKLRVFSQRRKRCHIRPGASRRRHIHTGSRAFLASHGDGAGKSSLGLIKGRYRTQCHHVFEIP